MGEILLCEILGTLTDMKFTPFPAVVGITLTNESLVIGSSYTPSGKASVQADQRLYIESPTISPSHAKICLLEDKWRIIDLNSDNGTWIIHDINNPITNPEDFVKEHRNIVGNMNFALGNVVIRLTPISN